MQTCNIKTRSRLTTFGTERIWTMYTMTLSFECVWLFWEEDSCQLDFAECGYMVSSICENCSFRHPSEMLI